MRYAEVASMISGFGLPYAYRAFPDNTEISTPFVVYYYTGNDDFFADNLNYQTIAALRIELYTSNKDFTTENAIEQALTASGIAFSKEEVFIEEQRLYEIIYESEVIISGK